MDPTGPVRLGAPALAWWALACVGCVSTIGVEPGREYRLAVDDAFTEVERADIRDGVERWREASSGRMNVHLVAQGEPSDGEIHRGQSDISARRRTLEGWIDADAMADDPEGVYAATLHIEGVLFGVPFVRDARAAMNPDDVADDLTEPDLEACRSVGLC